VPDLPHREALVLPTFYTQIVGGLGRILVVSGIVLVLLGLLVSLAGRLPFRLGRLPGDIYIHGKNTTFYFPLATCILLSVLFSLVLWIFRR
jgi:hypothetical protein